MRVVGVRGVGGMGRVVPGLRDDVVGVGCWLGDDMRRVGRRLRDDVSRMGAYRTA